MASEQLSEEAAQRIARFHDAALSRAQMCMTFMNFVSSTTNRSAVTMMCWMKKTTDAISDVARKDSVQVAVIQTHGEDGAILLMLRWSLNGVSSVHCVQMCWDPPILSVSEVLVGRHAISVKSFCASLSIWMHTSSVRSVRTCESRNVESFCKRSWIPSNFLLMNLFLNLWEIWWSFCSFVFPNRWPRGRLFLMTKFGIERRIQLPSADTSAGCISQEMPTSAVDDALIPVKKAFWALHFRSCLA